MKIVVLGNCQGLGGGPTHFQLLLNFLNTEGHQLLGIGIGDIHLCRITVHDGHEFVRIRQSTRTLFDKLAKGLEFRAACAKAVKFHPDLFIAIGYGNSYPYLASKLKRSHNFSFYQDLIANPNPCDPLRMKLVDAFDAVAVQSISMRSPFLHCIPTQKPVIDLPCFAYSPPFAGFPELPSNNGTIKLAYFGRLAHNKGIVPFISAFSKAVSDHDFSLDIYGGGPEKLAIESKIKSVAMADRIQLKGVYPSGAEYSSLLKSYHALVLPSIGGEGLPLVLLEAMSIGLPFLATDIGAIRDAAYQNPDVVVVPPNEQGFLLGLNLLATNLINRAIKPSRLRDCYESRFSSESFASTWRSMLVSPRQYFLERDASLRNIS